MSDNERLEKLEVKYDQVDKQLEDLCALIDSQQARLQRDLTNLTSHFVKMLEPKFREIVKDEWKKLNGRV